LNEKVNSFSADKSFNECELNCVEKGKIDQTHEVESAFFG